MILQVSAFSVLELSGAPVTIYGLETFDQFLQCSSDSTLHQRNVLVNGLIDNGHAEMFGLCFKR